MITSITSNISQCDPQSPYILHKFADETFAIFHKSIDEKNNKVSIDLKDYNIIFIAPLIANDDITVYAKNIIVLSSIKTQGDLRMYAENNIATLGAELQSNRNMVIHAIRDVFLYDIIKERKLLINDAYHYGLLQKHPQLINDALVETIDAIDDPSAEKTSSLDERQALMFFRFEKIEEVKNTISTD